MIKYRIVRKAGDGRYLVQKNVFYIFWVTVNGDALRFSFEECKDIIDIRMQEDAEKEQRRKDKDIITYYP